MSLKLYAYWCPSPCFYSAITINKAVNNEFYLVQNKYIPTRSLKLEADQSEICTICQIARCQHLLNYLKIVNKFLIKI